MKVEMLMPQMGESIAEATISKWLKQPGEQVKKDEVILEISTDKVDSEIPSPASGTLAELLFREGDVVPVKTKIAVIDTDGGAAAVSVQPARQAPAQTAPSPAAAQAKAQAPAAKTEKSAPASPPAALNGGGVHGDHSSGRFYSPLVKSLAEKHGVALAELEMVQGSGQGGRVTKQDFMAYLNSRGAAPRLQAPLPAAAQPKPILAAPVREAKVPATDMPALDVTSDGNKVVLMDNMRQAIADHMVRSKHTSPHVYSIQEVDVSRIARWREQHGEAFKAQEGFSLSYTPFFLEAAVKALLQFPYVNSSLDGKKIILKKHINLGCAVALGNSGLIVPVIKRAEERNFVGLARALTDLAGRARNKKLLPDDVMDGTFTVTNPGVFGTMIGTPIINQPQVAILCLGAIKKRPVVIDDMIAIREICYLTLSYDHRIVDGSLGGQYLAFVREYLENWDMNRTLY